MAPQKSEELQKAKSIDGDKTTESEEDSDIDELEDEIPEESKKTPRVNLDEGIAGNDYKPTKFLEKKAYLIEQLEKADYKQATEKLGYRSLKYMLERLQGQQGYEIAMIRELDPYFNFQTKINSTLGNISQGKDSRMKI